MPATIQRSVSSPFPPPTTLGSFPGVPDVIHLAGTRNRGYLHFYTNFLSKEVVLMLISTKAGNFEAGTFTIDVDDRTLGCVCSPACARRGIATQARTKSREA
jgi:hypothetical protein